MMINLHAAWIGFFLGCLAGVVTGLFFHTKDWLGGYGSWQRRMIRLGHISFFGIGLLNLSFALTINLLNFNDRIQVSSVLLIAGGIAMPLVCYLSAWKPFFRNLFFIPALSVTISIGLFVWRMFT